MKPSHISRRKGNLTIFLLFGLLVATTAMVLPWVPPVQASTTLTSSKSSAVCEEPQSTASFSCSLSVISGSTIIVFFGCLAAQSAPCSKLSVTDSQNDTYTFITNAFTGCDNATCNEEAFWARASSTGNDSISLNGSGLAYYGADLYDVLGVNTSAMILTGFGGSSMNNPPAIFSAYTPSQGGFVAAGVIANDASQFTAGSDFTLISGQPCYQCGMAGGWQASEYVIWDKAGPTDTPFGYPATNDGWAEISLSFAPSITTTSLTCSPSPGTVSRSSVCMATVKGNSPTGSIKWTSNGTGTFSPSSSCTLSSGSCSVSYTPSAVASHVVITAGYGGDPNNPQSSGNLSLSVAKTVATTSVLCSPSPVDLGSATTCAATTDGDSPTGTITWASSGVANFSPTSTCTLSAGSCAVNYTPSSATSPVTITAIYAGDANNTASSGTFKLTVGPSTTGTSTSSTTTTGTSTTDTTRTSTSSISHSTTVSSTVATAVSTGASSTSSSSSSTAASSSAIQGFMPLVAEIVVVAIAVVAFSLSKKDSHAATNLGT